MTSTEFKARLTGRAEKVNVSVPPVAKDQLEAYFRLLAHWNTKINLTGLPLIEPTDETLDRLLVEPMAAARYLEDSSQSWFDLGSGGGSPAIPLKIMWPSKLLTMIEIRTRKAAFLREVVRMLQLTHTIVADQSVDSVAAATPKRSVELITIRALRVDRALLSTLERLLAPDGVGLVFHSRAVEMVSGVNVQNVRTVQLETAGRPVLTFLRPMFHVEQMG